MHLEGEPSLEACLPEGRCAFGRHSMPAYQSHNSRKKEEDERQGWKEAGTSGEFGLILEASPEFPLLHVLQQQL